MIDMPDESGSSDDAFRPMDDTFQPMPHAPTPAEPMTPPPAAIYPARPMVVAPLAKPVKKEPGIVELLIGVAIAWAVELTLGFGVGVVAGVKAISEGVPPDQIMTQIGSMAWLLLPTVLISNSCAVLTCWYLMCKRQNRSIAEGLALGKPPWRFVGLAFVIAILFNTLLILMPFADAAPDEHVPVVQLMQGGGLGLFAFFAVVVAPMEEIYYRGFLYPLLRKYIGVGAAIPLVAVWFTAIHAFQLQGALLALVPIFVMAMIWTSLREVSGSLWPSIVCHVTYNGSLMLLNLML